MNAAQLSNAVFKLIKNMGYGLFNLTEQDVDILTTELQHARTETEYDIIKRRVLRWSYATEPLEQWTDWRDAMEATAN